MFYEIINIISELSSKCHLIWSSGSPILLALLHSEQPWSFGCFECNRVKWFGLPNLTLKDQHCVFSVNTVSQSAKFIFTYCLTKIYFVYIV